jgi:phosphatidylglycerophosphate synthase
VTWEEYAAAWSRLHGGFDPTTAPRLIRGWVLIAYRAGTWLGSRRVGPTAVTVAGLILCLGVPLAVPAGRPGLAVGALLVLLAALADTFDGAVAVVTGRATRLGFVLDSVSDRVGEAAWLVAFWLAGAPAGLVVAAGAVAWLHEYARARAAVAGMDEIGVVTIAERPTRVSLALSGLLLASLFGSVMVSLLAAIWLLVGLVAFGQLAVAVRRALR